MHTSNEHDDSGRRNKSLSVTYNDIFGTPEEQADITQAYQIIISIRESLVNQGYILDLADVNNQ